uniref:Abortive infection protein n=1 Tax=archaeon enrichment culture clone 1(2010) TaxID=795325 RepID=D9CGD2_9ARCH|nr:abortive infection protein [archaeon enrichment culture clone 1(2010)]
MSEEIQFQEFPSYSVLQLLASLLAVGLVAASLWLLGLILGFFAVLCMVVALIFGLTGYFLAPNITASGVGGFRQQLLTFLLPSVSVLMFGSLFYGMGFMFYWVTIVMAVTFTLLYKPPKMPKPDIKIGVMGGFTMFIVAILVSILLGEFKIADTKQTLQALQFAWVPVNFDTNANPITAQLTAIEMFLIVAMGEELWARLTMGFGATSITGPRTAWFWASFWFLFMHTPSRLQYGLLAPVIIALLGIVMIPFFVFFRKNPNIFTGIIMHATYNTLVSGFSYGTLLVDVIVLAVLVYVASKVTEAKVEIKLPETIKEVIAE